MKALVVAIVLASLTGTACAADIPTATGYLEPTTNPTWMLIDKDESLQLTTSPDTSKRVVTIEGDDYAKPITTTIGEIREALRAWRAGK